MEIIKKINVYKLEFLNYLKACGRSLSTINSYAYTIGFFIRFVIKKHIKSKDIFSLTGLVRFNSYLTSYRTKKGSHLKAWSVQKIFSGVSVFFKYLSNMDYILINPFDKLEKRRNRRGLPKKIPTKKEVEKIMSEVDITTEQGFRTRTMLELFYSTGIRRSELVNLTVHDVDLNNGYIRILKGKGGKSRIVPVGKIACEFLEKYITEIRPKLLKTNVKETALFVSIRRKKISKNSINLILKKEIQKAKLLKTYSCHSFRHACATEMLKGNATIRHIQELLGHEYLSSTQIYTHVLPLNLLEVHKKYHPSWTLFDE